MRKASAVLVSVFLSGVALGLAQAQGPAKTKLKNILVLDQAPANGHVESRRDLNNALKELGTANGFTITTLGANDNVDLAFTEANLAKFQVIIFSNNDGVHNYVKGTSRTNFEKFVENGGGFIAVHAASAFITGWTWIDNVLVQKFYSPHGNNQPTADLTHDVEGIKDGTETKGIFKGITAPLAFLDEYYSFQKSPRGVAGVTILVTVDEKTYSKPVNGPMGSDHPVIWAKTQGKGRVVHNSMGHSFGSSNVYTLKNSYLKSFFYNSLRYAAGDFLGCTDPNNPNYNPDATKNDAANCVANPIALSAKKALGESSILMNGKSIDVTFNVEGSHEVLITDINGKLIERQTGSGLKAYSLPSPKKAGMYYIKAKAGKNLQSQRITVL